MAWYLYDSTGKVIVSQGDFDITIDADSGTGEVVNNGDTATWAGGVGIGTVVSATNTITIETIWDYENILGSSGSFDITLATDIPKWDSDVKTIIMEVGIRSLVSANSDLIYMFLNNDTTLTNYHRQTLGAALGAAAVGEGADALLTGSAPANTSPADSFWFATITIGEANSSSYVKVIRPHGGGLFTSTDVRADAGSLVWKNATAVTRIQIRTDNHPTDLLATGSFVRIRLIK